MAATSLISLSEYLDTSYRPDREYIDGQLRERNVGQWNHARTMALLAGWFGSNELGWSIIGAMSQRVRVSATRIRIPDLILAKAEPQPDVTVAPPVLVVEILSPDDTYTDTQERCQDYQFMGVTAIWIIDPSTRSGRVCIDNNWEGARKLIVPGTPIYADLDNLFAKLDESRPRP